MWQPASPPAQRGACVWVCVRCRLCGDLISRRSVRCVVFRWVSGWVFCAPRFSTPCLYPPDRGSFPAPPPPSSVGASRAPPAPPPPRSSAHSRRLPLHSLSTTVASSPTACSPLHFVRRQPPASFAPSPPCHVPPPSPPCPAAAAPRLARVRTLVATGPSRARSWPPPSPTSLSRAPCPVTAAPPKFS